MVTLYARKSGAINRVMAQITTTRIIMTIKTTVALEMRVTWGKNVVGTKSGRRGGVAGEERISLLY